MEKHRIVIFNNQIMPYRIPLFDAISQVISHNITVLYGSKRAQDREWTLDTENMSYNYLVLRHWSIKLPKPSYHDEWRIIRINPGLLFSLQKLNPTLIIAYEYSIPTTIALLYSKLSGCKLMIWSEMTAHTDRQLGRGQEMMRRLIIPRTHGFIGTSHAACDNFRRRGVPDHQIFLAPQTFDAGQFTQQEKTSTHPPTVIYAGYLSERKGVRHLVQTFNAVVDALPTAQLIMIGSGAEEDALQEIIAAHQLENNITLTGFIEPNEIPQYYAQGDVFMLPSLEDTFGVVATEAIAAGLTLVCSPFAGFSSHMTHGKNGLIVDPTDHDQLANAMIDLLSNPDKRQQLNNNAQQLLPQFTPKAVAQNFVDAIEQTLNSST